MSEKDIAHRPVGGLVWMKPKQVAERYRNDEPYECGQANFPLRPPPHCKVLALTTESINYNK